MKEKKKYIARKIAMGALALQVVNSSVSLSAPLTFSSLGFVHCDAKLLGMFWGTNPRKAKKMANKHLRRPGGKLKVLDAVKLARRSHSCKWADTGFNYNDAKKLAQMWGTSVGVAKTRVAKLVTAGKTQKVNKLLRKR